MTIPPGIRLVRKDRDLPMRLLGLLLGHRFREEFWTTYRLPFGRPTITYPPKIRNPRIWEKLLRHELVHVEQFRPWWGPFLVALLVSVFPLPFLFSGRWLVERPAYLLDIKSGRMGVDEAVETLWNGYGWPWPRSWMRRWFLSRLGERG